MRETKPERQATLAVHGQQLYVPFAPLCFAKDGLTGSSPVGNVLVELKNRTERNVQSCFWCERRDLNPYGITTRPSNVRVCRFRHSRIFSSPFLTTNDIISKSRGSVNTFLENILFFQKRITLSIFGTSILKVVAVLFDT